MLLRRNRNHMSFIECSIPSILIRDQWVSVSCGRRNNKPHSSVSSQETSQQRLSIRTHAQSSSDTQLLWIVHLLLHFAAYIPNTHTHSHTLYSHIYRWHPKRLQCSCQMWFPWAKWPLILLLTGSLSSPVVNFSLSSIFLPLSSSPDCFSTMCHKINVSPSIFDTYYYKKRNEMT